MTAPDEGPEVRPAEEDTFSRHVCEGCREARALADRIVAGELDAVLPLIRRLRTETEVVLNPADLAWNKVTVERLA